MRSILLVIVLLRIVKVFGRSPVDSLGSIIVRLSNSSVIRTPHLAKNSHIFDGLDYILVLRIKSRLG